MTELVRTYVERYITGSWSNMSSYVVGDIVGEYLIKSPDVDEMLASVGQMEFTVDNGDGSFSPNRNFQKNTPIRVRTIYDGVSKTRFVGFILRLDPDTLEWGDQYVRVTVVNWMRIAVEHSLIVPELLEDKTADEAVAYLLSLMDKQPENVEYHEGREVFDFVFDVARKDTKVYTELSRIAHSEFAPMYMKGDGTLVVESANTRNGTRELTKVPVRPSDLHAILTDPNGGLILVAEGTQFAILADERRTPNLATGTFQPRDIEIENGDAQINRVIMRTYPAREDVSPVLLFQLDRYITLATFGNYTLRGNYADPQGGLPIAARNIQPVITGTFRFTDKDDTVDLSTQLVITQRDGSQFFEHTIHNAGAKGVLREYKVYGEGIYPYNPVSTPVNISGSISNYGILQKEVDQRYQDDVNVSYKIGERIADDEKEPRNRLWSVTFDASLSPELMQASQYMDSGDLTWIRNVKPEMDTYAYIRGKRFVITPAGFVTEQWHLIEMDSLRKGLQPIALGFTSLNSAQNGVDFGIVPYLSNLPKKTITGWVYNDGALSIFPPIAKYSGESDGWWFFQLGAVGVLEYRQNFTPNDGQWRTASGTITPSSWYHFAVSYDKGSDQNDPIMYINGVPTPLTEYATPLGDADGDEDATLTLGNINIPLLQYVYRHNGRLKDLRIYDRFLERDEILTLYANPNNPLLVTDGLVFQGPCVKIEDYAGITGTVLYPENKMIDNIYGIRGTPHWNSSSGTAYALRALDPLI